MFEEITVPSADGHRIRAYAWPHEAPRGLVQIVHGMAEHAQRYDRLAGALHDAGWAVFAHDQRGHGASVESERDLGHFADRDGWRRVVDDVVTVRQAARERAPGGPLVLLGHSMGSFVSLYEQTEHPGSVDALVSSGSNVGGGPLVAAGKAAAHVERLRGGRRAKSALLSFLSFGSYNNAFKPTRTDFDWLSRDEAEVDAYVADPRCGFLVSNQLWLELLGALQELGERERLRRLPHDLPIYLVAGDRDPVSGGGDGVRALGQRLREAGVGDVTVQLYPEARHEVFNETNRDEVTADLLAFLDTRFAR